jgi:hypothetical protein
MLVNGGDACVHACICLVIVVAAMAVACDAAGVHLQAFLRMCVWVYGELACVGVCMCVCV